MLFHLFYSQLSLMLKRDVILGRRCEIVLEIIMWYNLGWLDSKFGKLFYKCTSVCQ